MRTDELTAPQAAIPVVDFTGFDDDDPTARAATAAALRAALESHGFLYLQHHGVPAPLVEAIFGQARAFFALPLADKQAARPPQPGSTLGYGALGGQALEAGRPADLKEIFQASPEAPYARPNAWPADRPAFRETVLAFHAAAMRSCARLMAAIAVSLGLPEGYFAPYYDQSDSTLRLLHYPTLSAPPAPGQLRAGAHTDFGGLSLLFPGAEGGLEVQLADGSWVAAPARPDAALVNSGDLIERWSNGVFRSSPHRVVAPEGAAADRDRYSVVLFHSPNRDAPIACLEPCQSAERPARFPPITAGEHVLARVRASREQLY